MPEDYDQDFEQLISDSDMVELPLALLEIYDDYIKNRASYPDLGDVERYELRLNEYGAVLSLVADTGLPVNFICAMLVLHRHNELHDEDAIRETGHYIETISDYLDRRRRALN